MRHLTVIKKSIAFNKITKSNNKEGVNLPELHNIQKNLLGSTGWAPGA